jgi:hypothetical protein
LEGTGALVIDYWKHRAYCSYSHRGQREIFEEWCRKYGYEAIGFESVSSTSQAYYLTDMMLSIGNKYAIVCYDAIREDRRKEVLTKLEEDRELIYITQE